MLLLELTVKSLRRRGLTTVLTIVSIAMAVVLLVGIETTRKSSRASLSGVVSGTDLLVGERTGEIQLLMYSIFHLGSPTGGISYDAFETWRKHPAVKWAIPISLGDSHREFRVVGTSSAFYRHYSYNRGQRLKFKQGRQARGPFDVVLGAAVAEKYDYRLKRRLVLSHGIGTGGFLDHRDKPFRVVGILKPTGTPADRALYVTLEGIEALHMDWMKTPGAKGRGSRAAVRRIPKPEKITSFLLGAKSRILTLRLQRDIAAYKSEPLMAIIPGMVLLRMWDAFSIMERVLLLISGLVIVTGLISVFVSLHASLNERRREIAILRAMGGGPGHVLGLLLMEAVMICTAGILLGYALLHGSLVLAGPMVEARFGLRPVFPGFALSDILITTFVLLSGLLAGLGPALRAYRISLHDGLTLKF